MSREFQLKQDWKMSASRAQGGREIIFCFSISNSDFYLACEAQRPLSSLFFLLLLLCFHPHQIDGPYIDVAKFLWNCLFFPKIRFFSNGSMGMWTEAKYEWPARVH